MYTSYFDTASKKYLNKTSTFFFMYEYKTINFLWNLYKIGGSYMPKLVYFFLLMKKLYFKPEIS